MANPTYENISLRDINTKTLSLTQNSSQLVQDVSVLSIRIAGAESPDGIPITEYSATAGTQSKTSKSPSFVFGEIGNVDEITITIKDILGGITSIQQPITVIPYSPVQGSLSVSRSTTNSTQVILSVSGSFSDLAGKNTFCGLRYRYKESSSTLWGNWIDADPSVVTDGTSFSMTKTLDGFSSSIPYHFEVDIQDALTEKTLSKQLDGPSFVPLKGSILEAVTVPNGTDFNTLTTPGYYRCGFNNQTTNNLNMPVKSAFLMGVYSLSGDFVVQDFIRASGDRYQRYFADWSNTWTEWKQFYNDAYHPHAGNADTVDGRHFLWEFGNGSPTHLWGSNNNSVNQVVFSPDNVTVGTAKKLQSARIYKDVTISIGASEALKSIIVQHGLNTTTPIVMLSGNIGNINLTWRVSGANAIELCNYNSGKNQWTGRVFFW